jgi:hypothetical protein
MATTFVISSNPTLITIEKPTLSLKPYYNVTKIVVDTKQKCVYIYTDISIAGNTDFEAYEEPKEIKDRIRAFMKNYKGYGYLYRLDEAAYLKTHNIKINTIKGPQTTGVIPKIPHSATGDWKKDSQAFHDYLGFRYDIGTGPTTCNFFSCNSAIIREGDYISDDIQGWYTFYTNTDYTFALYAWNHPRADGGSYTKIIPNPVVKEILRYYYPKHYEQLYKMIDQTVKAKTEKQAIYFRKIFYFENRAFYIDYLEKHLGIFMGKLGKKLTPVQIKMRDYRYLLSPKQ